MRSRFVLSILGRAIALRWLLHKFGASRSRNSLSRAILAVFGWRLLETIRRRSHHPLASWVSVAIYAAAIARAYRVTALRALLVGALYRLLDRPRSH